MKTSKNKGNFCGRTIEFSTCVQYFGHKIRTLKAISQLFFGIKLDTLFNIHTIFFENGFIFILKCCIRKIRQTRYNKPYTIYMEVY